MEEVEIDFKAYFAGASRANVERLCKQSKHTHTHSAHFSLARGGSSPLSFIVDEEAMLWWPLEQPSIRKCTVIISLALLLLFLFIFGPQAVPPPQQQQ